MQTSCSKKLCKEHATRIDKHAKIKKLKVVDHGMHHDSYDICIYPIVMVCMSLHKGQLATKDTGIKQGFEKKVTGKRKSYNEG